MRPETRQNLQLAAHLSTVGLSFVLALALGFGGGHLLDNWLGTRPWFSLLGFLFGLAAGVLNVYRIMRLVGPQKAPSERPRGNR